MGEIGAEEIHLAFQRQFLQCSIQSCSFKMRNSPILKEFYRNTTNRPSPAKEVRSRLRQHRSKDFLTDTQPSDHTKSSNESTSKVEELEALVRGLQKENLGLKEKIVDLRASLCMDVRGDKVREVVREAELLRQKLQTSQRQLAESLQERESLLLSNRCLQARCEALTQQLLSASSRDRGDLYTSREVSPRESVRQGLRWRAGARGRRE